MHPEPSTCSPSLHIAHHEDEEKSEEVETQKMSCSIGAREKLLITTYQEVNDLFRSNTRCDDENVRDGGNTDLPEQHFSLIKKKIFIVIVGAHFLSFSDAAHRDPID